MSAVETETAAMAGTPTLALPRKRERERTALTAKTFHHDASPSSGRSDTRGWSGRPLSRLRGRAGVGAVAQSEISMADEKSPVWNVSSKLRSNARALRKNSTAAERWLWSELRDHRLNGMAFRRQVPIENYVADFVCHTAGLVIELDGGQHFSDEAEQADARRSAAIEAKGFQVLRFNNHDVMTNRRGVLETIATALAARAP